MRLWPLVDVEGLDFTCTHRGRHLLTSHWQESKGSTRKLQGANYDRNNFFNVLRSGEIVQYCLKTFYILIVLLQFSKKIIIQIQFIKYTVVIIKSFSLRK